MLTVAVPSRFVRPNPPYPLRAGAREGTPLLGEGRPPGNQNGKEGKAPALEAPEGGPAGVDPARGGGDKTRIIDRQGRRLGGRVDFVMDTDDTMVVAGEVARVIQHVTPKAVFIDVTDLGAGVYDRLRELG